MGVEPACDQPQTGRGGDADFAIAVDRLGALLNIGGGRAALARQVDKLARGNLAETRLRTKRQFDRQSTQIARQI